MKRVNRPAAGSVSRARGSGSAVVLGLAMIGGLAGCAPESTAERTPSSTAGEEWSYRGANGPEHWGEFGAACENRTASHESPIDIATANLGSGTGSDRVRTNYTSASFELENNGHTVEAVPVDPQANSVEVGGTRYFLQQFHFHASSEHRVDGRSTAAELHLVHRSEDGRLLVLAVLLEAGAENAALDELFDRIPHEVSERGERLENLIDPVQLLPRDRASFQYDGSLTTPPCTEGVRWNVFTSPVTVSAAQLADYVSVYPDNHRPVQPLHGRRVTAVDGTG